MEEKSEKTRGRFFREGDLTGQAVDLPPEESAHALKSRRLKPGSRVEIFNGEGMSRLGVIEEASRNQVRVRFVEPARMEEASKELLVVAASPPRGDRMTFLVEKLSELGADALLPTVFQRSLDAGVQAHTRKAARWRRTALESAKQCGRSFLLKVEEPIIFADLLVRAAPFEEKIIFLSQGKDFHLFEKILAQGGREPGKTLLVIGPQGGITEEETAQALAAGMTPATLGSRILRIETAALAACALFRSRRP